MRAIIVREMRNYLKSPLFWAGVLLVIFGVFNAITPYLTTHYLEPGEEIVNEYPETVHSGEIYEGYVPSTKEQQRKSWNERITDIMVAQFEMNDQEIQKLFDKMDEMEIKEACAYLEDKYGIFGAYSEYVDSAYHKGTTEEINTYLKEKMKDHSFSFYFSRKFADFAGMFMGFFAAIMLSVLFLQDTRKHTYELLHTKPVKAWKYVMGKVGGGFCICLFTLTILNLLFWVLCLVYTRGSGFEVRLWDFLNATILYILPNMLMIVCVYMLISLLFKNPLPGVPLLILYMLYSNMGSRNAEGMYGYFGRPLAIMVRFPGQFFDTAPPPLVLLNQSFLILVSAGIIFIAIRLWKRRRI